MRRAYSPTVPERFPRLSMCTMRRDESTPTTLPSRVTSTCGTKVCRCRPSNIVATGRSASQSCIGVRMKSATERSMYRLVWKASGMRWPRRVSFMV